MNTQLRLILLGLLFVTLIDAGGSIASRVLNFDYGRFALLSLLNYGFIGYLTAKHYHVSKALVAGAALGVLDVTAGWQLSIVLEANAEGPQPAVGSSLWLVTVLFGTGLAAVAALVGGWIGTKASRKAAPRPPSRRGSSIHTH